MYVRTCAYMYVLTTRTVREKQVHCRRREKPRKEGNKIYYDIFVNIKNRKKIKTKQSTNRTEQSVARNETNSTEENKRELN